MPVLTVTAKGQVTFRRDMLEHLGVRPGDKLAVHKLPDGRIEVRAAGAGSIADLFGALKQEGAEPLSLDALDAIIAEGWAGKHRDPA